LEHVEQSQ
jgi:DNA-binding protein H-NS